jgi:hypothetical protein
MDDGNRTRPRVESVHSHRILKFSALLLMDATCSGNPKPTYVASPQLKDA